MASSLGIKSHCILALNLHVILIIFGLYQDNHIEVQYTDIDYKVYSDAAQYLYNGSSPFIRQTYRYSPLLAILLLPNILLHESFGKFLFSIFDVVTGFLMYKILRHYSVPEKGSKMYAMLWLYNPICAVISTRGSSDSLMTTLILCCIWFQQKKNTALLGLTYGLSIHLRIYPCIYMPIFYCVMSNLPLEKTECFSTKFVTLLQPNIEKIKFLVCTLLSFCIPTLISYHYYGMHYVEEAFLYHVYRKDIRHNFSPYFYFSYLSEYNLNSVPYTLSVLPFIIQSLLILATTWTFCAKKSLPVCLFVLTYIFVTFNKVCTSQYFLWYLSLFPMTLPLLQSKLAAVFASGAFWFSSQVLWLLPAYFLEFQGSHMYLYIWGASMFMLLVNVYLIHNFCRNVPVSGFSKKL